MQRNSKLARIFIDFSQWVVFYHYTVVYSAMALVIKGNCIDCIIMQMYLETWKYMILRRSLAHISYNFFCKYQKAGYVKYCPSLQKWLPFFFFYLPVSLFRRKMRTLFRWGFFFGRGGGACQLNILVPPYENPRPHSAPYWKNPSYAA